VVTSDLHPVMLDEQSMNDLRNSCPKDQMRPPYWLYGMISVSLNSNNVQ
jgi:hypothetical protein